MQDKKIFSDKTYTTNEFNQFEEIPVFIDDNEHIDTSFNSFNDYLNIPQWNIKDFIDMRKKFQMIGADGTDSGALFETGNYFYRLFFDFKASHGLFGSIISDQTGKVSSNQNTAVQYLLNNVVSTRFSDEYRSALYFKYQSLVSFTKILNYITNECPWFFKDIGGLGEATKYNFKEITTSTPRNITISFNPDAIDMRISTLFDLYKSACFDYVNFKEVVPENLRKFDMSILLFNTPTYGDNILRETNPDTGEVTDSYLSTDFNSGISKTLTFKLLIFKNCEFVIDSMSSVEDVFNNEKGFNNNLQVSISYDRCYTHNVNRHFKLISSDTNFYISEFSYNESLETGERLSNIQLEAALNIENFEEYDMKAAEEDEYMDALAAQMTAEIMDNHKKQSQYETSTNRLLNELCPIKNIKTPNNMKDQLTAKDPGIAKPNRPAPELNRQQKRAQRKAKRQAKRQK